MEGLDPGLYRYMALEHKLGSHPPGWRIQRRNDRGLRRAAAGPDQRGDFIWAAVPYRTVWRYTERSYRYMYLDAGQVCQNLHLAAESINCGVCAIGTLTMTQWMPCRADPAGDVRDLHGLSRKEKPAQ